MGRTPGKLRRCQIERPAGGLERLERDYGAGVGDAWDYLYLVAHEVADIDMQFHLEFGQDVIVAGNRIGFGGNLRFCQRAGDLVGAPERAFDLNEEVCIRSRPLFAALFCNNFDVPVHPCLNLERRLKDLGFVPGDHDVLALGEHKRGKSAHQLADDVAARREDCKGRISQRLACGFIDELERGRRQRWRIVTSICSPEVTLISALTIEFEGVAAGGASTADLAELPAALTPERPPTVSR